MSNRLKEEQEDRSLLNLSNSQMEIDLAEESYRVRHGDLEHPSFKSDDLLEGSGLTARRIVMKFPHMLIP